ncbi:MAG: riboflavin synthase [Candidatus Obscuribacterales bacterium]|nr:riboflavin synthase [Candidatus Obscuribacterales bacterium]
MFTGIVEEVGKIAALVDSADGRRLKIQAKKVTTELSLGESVAVSGACLTVVEQGADWFSTDASFETLRKTKLGSLKVGSKVNLERALKLSDRMGGHIVSGHVDGLGHLASIKSEGFSKIMEFKADAALAPYFIEKGSVTIDGISLTVVGLSDVQASALSFSVAIIPHTLAETTLSEIKVGDQVNLEADLIGKYVARWLGAGGERKINKEGLSMSLLSEQGYT